MLRFLAGFLTGLIIGAGLALMAVREAPIPYADAYGKIISVNMKSVGAIWANAPAATHPTPEE